MKRKLSPETLADLKRSGLTAADAAKLHVEENPTSSFRPAKSYRLRYHDIGGKPNGMYRDRFVGDNVPRDAKGKPRRYTQPAGYGPKIYLPPLMQWKKIAADPRVALWVTEGEKKAAAACKRGVATLGLGGVFNFMSGGRLISCFQQFVWEGRPVVVCFDAEPAGAANHNVALAEQRLAGELQRLGAVVSLVHLPARPDAKVGLDDYLLDHSAKDLLALPRLALESLPTCTDAGNARRLVRLHGCDLRYVPGLGWLVWDGTRWRVDAIAAMRRSKETAAAIYGEAQAEKDDTRKQTLAKWAIQSQNRARLEAMLALAQSELETALDVATLDADPWLLGVRNGVVDLKTGELVAAQRDMYITKQAPIVFDPRGKSPTWEKFLRRILPDADVRDFVQRAAGLTLTGVTAEKALFFLYGPPDGGKTTLIECLRSLFGDLAYKVDIGVLLKKREQSGPTPELIPLRGARFVSSQELDDGQHFNAAVLKELTGGDTITCRDLHTSPINFAPSHKLWLYGNHKPQLRGDDPAVWRRMNMIPCTISIPLNEQDRSLPEKLRAESSGILNWCLDGLRDYHANGLQPPSRVQSATESYRQEMDTFGQFLQECTVVAPKGRELLAELYAAYCGWAERGGFRYPMTKPRFAKCLDERGFKSGRGTDNAATRSGLRLKNKAKWQQK